MHNEDLKEYRELLVKNQLPVKDLSVKEYKQIKERLLFIELNITGKEIIENTKLAFT